LNKFSQQCNWSDTDITEEILNKIHQIFSKNSVEEIIEGLKKDNSEFAAKQLQALKKMSPSSLKITLQQMKRGKNLSFKEALELEYAISQNFMKGHDFFEGVRSLLVTKTNDPKWKPPTLEEIKEEDVNKYFNYTNEMTKLDLSNIMKTATKADQSKL